MLLKKVEVFKYMFENFPDVVGIDDLRKMLGIGRNKAYELVNAEKVKSIRIGKQIKIAKTWVIDYIQSVG